MNYQIQQGDCLELMKKIPDGSVDMILTDLPYNLTDCSWDKSAIDLAAFWEQVKRILKPYCSAVLFSSGKFTHKLISSNFDWYKYKWIWVKNTATMFVHAKNAPMRKFEEILVFSDGVINHKSVSKRRMKYNPQGLIDCTILKDNLGKSSETEIRAHGKFKPPKWYDSPTQLRAGGSGKRWSGIYDDCASNWQRCGRVKSGANATKTQIHNPHPENTYIQEQTGYPSDVLHFDALSTNGRFHPTQKPVDLLEYLIKTYTDAGETVLDATMGSGSTGVAAVNTGRKFIGFETEQKFFDIAKQRIEKAIAESEQSLF